MSAHEEAKEILARWDAASFPDDLGLHNAGGFAQDNCVEIREAMRALLAALPSPLADDVREALADLIEDHSYNGGHGGMGGPEFREMVYEATDAILAAFEVRPYWTVTEDATQAAMDALGCEQTHDQGEGACCDASIISCSHPVFLYCQTHDEESGIGEPCPVAVKVAAAVLSTSGTVTDTDSAREDLAEVLRPFFVGGDGQFDVVASEQALTAVMTCPHLTVASHRSGDAS